MSLSTHIHLRQNNLLFHEFGWNCAQLSVRKFVDANLVLSPFSETFKALHKLEDRQNMNFLSGFRGPLNVLLLVYQTNKSN